MNNHRFPSELGPIKLAISCTFFQILEFNWKSMEVEKKESRYN